MRKCNKDCFNCKFDDCILELDEIPTLSLESIRRNKETSHKKYLRNRDKYIERATKWREEHIEQAREINRRAVKNYYEKNRERLSEYYKARYQRLKAERLKEQCIESVEK